MSKIAFTPRPWEPKTKAQWESGFDFFSGADGAFVFMADVDECDIPLISAAPDLYEALAGMLDFWGGYECPEVDVAIAVMQKIGADRWSMQAQMEAEALAKASPFNKEGE